MSCGRWFNNHSWSKWELAAREFTNNGADTINVRICLKCHLLDSQGYISSSGGINASFSELNRVKKSILDKNLLSAGYLRLK